MFYQVQRSCTAFAVDHIQVLEAPVAEGPKPKNDSAGSDFFRDHRGTYKKPNQSVSSPAQLYCIGDT